MEEVSRGYELKAFFFKEKGGKNLYVLTQPYLFSVREGKRMIFLFIFLVGADGQLVPVEKKFRISILKIFVTCKCKGRNDLVLV